MNKGGDEAMENLCCILLLFLLLMDETAHSSSYTAALCKIGTVSPLSEYLIAEEGRIFEDQLMT